MVPSVFMGGVNTTAHGNTISQHPHNAVWMQGNDHTFGPGNRLSEICSWALDSGALYSGRDYTYRGNSVVGNSFSHVRLASLSSLSSLSSLFSLLSALSLSAFPSSQL
jgi:hypothetical protein